MPKILFYLTLLVFSLVVRGQETQLDSIFYFNKTHYADTMNMISTAIESVEDGYLIFGGYNIADTISRNSFKKIDKQGDFIFLKDYDYGLQSDKGIIERGGQVIQNSLGNLVLAYSYDTLGGASGRKLHKLIEMDFEGNVLQTALYGDTTQSQVSRAVVEVDDGYIILGAQNSDEQIRRMALIKVDYSFNEIWRKYYADNLGGAYHLRKTFWDDGFLIGGFSFTNDEYGFDSHALKLDSEGNIEWEYIDNVVENDAYMVPVIPFTEATYTEGQAIEYILLAEQHVPQSEEPFDDANDLSFSKLDENGNLLFKKVYDIPEFERAIQFESAIVTNDSTVIATIHNNYGFADVDVLLANISTKDGEVRWVQTLQTNDDMHRQDYMRDLQQTSDGGFILAGFRQTPGVQRSWVVKTDSLGNTCGFANCDSLVVIETIIEEPEDSTSFFIQNIENADFTVYPNPARGSITVSGIQQRQKYRVVNALGQQVLSGVLTENTIINIQDLNTGMYYIVLSDGQYSRFVITK